MGWGVASFLLISWDDVFFPRERLGNISGQNMVKSYVPNCEYPWTSMGDGIRLIFGRFFPHHRGGDGLILDRKRHSSHPGNHIHSQQLSSLMG